MNSLAVKKHSSKWEWGIPKKLHPKTIENQIKSDDSILYRYDIWNKNQATHD